MPSVGAAAGCWKAISLPAAPPPPILDHVKDPIGPENNSTLFQFASKRVRRCLTLVDDAIQSLSGSFGAQSQGIRPPAVSDDHAGMADPSSI